MQTCFQTYINSNITKPCTTILFQAVLKYVDILIKSMHGQQGEYEVCDTPNESLKCHFFKPSFVFSIASSICNIQLHHTLLYPFYVLLPMLLDLLVLQFYFNWHTTKKQQYCNRIFTKDLLFNLQKIVYQSKGWYTCAEYPMVLAGSTETSRHLASVYSSLSDRFQPNVRLLSNGHAGKPAANRHPISAHVLAGGGSPVRTLQLSREIAVLTWLVLVQ